MSCHSQKDHSPRNLKTSSLLGSLRPVQTPACVPLFNFTTGPFQRIACEIRTYISPPSAVPVRSSSACRRPPAAQEEYTDIGRQKRFQNKSQSPFLGICFACLLAYDFQAFQGNSMPCCLHAGNDTLEHIQSIQVYSGTPIQLYI